MNNGLNMPPKKTIIPVSTKIGCLKVFTKLKWFFTTQGITLFDSHQEVNDIFIIDEKYHVLGMSRSIKVCKFVPVS
jgi:hypothetical protein